MAKKKVVDLDLDEKEELKITEVATNAIEEAIEFVTKDKTEMTEEEEWQACLSRLKASTKKTYICIPHIVDEKIYLESPDLESCTGEQFLRWMYLVYPPAKDLGFTEDECGTFTYRDTMFNEVISSLKYLAFPKTKMNLNI